MKTTIKTLLASSLLTVILAMAVLSCAPEVELSSREWSKITADKNTSKLSIGSEAADKPSLIVSNLDYTGSNDWDKEVTIQFPKTADVLREKNAALTGKLSAFMTFYTFTKGTAGTDPDTLDTAFPYKFVRRGADGDITVRLDSVPDRNLVIKIDAGKYTYSGGKKLGGGNDTKFGIAYYDHYISCSVAHSSGSGTFLSPYKNWSLTIDSPPNTPLSGTSTFTGAVASLNLSVSGDLAGSIIDAELPGLVNKFKLEKYGTKGWETVSGDFKYDQVSTSGTYRNIIVTYTPDEFVPYRVKVNGVQNLETANTYYGVKQRIKVKGSFGNNTVVSDHVVWQDAKTGRLLATGETVGSKLFNFSRSQIDYDKGNKNIVIRLVFNSLSNPVSPGSNVWLKEIGLGEFKKNVKIVYSNSSLGEDPIISDLTFLDIKRVSYGTNKQALSPVDGDKINQIEITINSDNQLQGGKLSFLFAQGFKYDSDSIIFGNYDNWNKEIDGVRYFDYYAAWNLGGSSGDDDFSVDED